MISDIIARLVILNVRLYPRQDTLFVADIITVYVYLCIHDHH